MRGPYSRKANAKCEYACEKGKNVEYENEV